MAKDKKDKKVKGWKAHMSVAFSANSDPEKVLSSPPNLSLIGCLIKYSLLV